MRIALVTDAWFPQANGVVRTLSTVRGELEAEGHAFEVIHPGLFATRSDHAAGKRVRAASGFAPACR